MTTKNYARIQDGFVVELLTTSSDISTLFAPALIWVDISSLPQVIEGWTYNGTQFAPPAPVAAPRTGPPSLGELQAQLAALSAQIASLARDD